MIINNIQLRVARTVLKLGVRDIAKMLNADKSTIYKAEFNIHKSFLLKHNTALIEFFKSKNIIFPDQYSVQYSCPNNEDLSNDTLTTSFQLRVARCITDISAKKIGKALGLTTRFVGRNEKLPKCQAFKAEDKEHIDKLNDFFIEQQIMCKANNIILFKKYVDKVSDG